MHPLAAHSFPPLDSALLAFDAVSCERGGRSIFSLLSFELFGAAALQVQGDNGAGKTSLLRIAAGLLAPSGGRVLSRGEPVDSDRYRFGSELLYLGHHAAIKANLTAVENLQYTIDGRHRFELAAIFAALAAVGLAGYEDLPCRTFSAGQRRRVALALLLLSDARLWLLDEPFTAIDRGGVAMIEQLMAGHLGRGGAIVLTSHQPVSLAGLRTLNLTSGADDE